MKTKRFIEQSVEQLRTQIKTTLTNKYFNLFMDSYEFDGIDDEAADFIMRQFWINGTTAAFKIKHTDEIGFAPYASQKYNMYDFPEEVQLINKRNLPFIPNGVQVVNKDVVLGWIQSNHKPISLLVNYYIDRLTQIEMVINTNLQVSKLPWVIGISPTDNSKAKDIIDRILNDEIVVFMDLEDLNQVQSLTTNTPYIIDKLYSYKCSVENELLTFLGLDNVMQQSSSTTLMVDQVNANNEVINANQEGFMTHLNNFIDGINEVLGASLSVEPKHKPVTSVYEEGQDISSPYGGSENVDNDRE